MTLPVGKHRNQQVGVTKDHDAQSERRGAILPVSEVHRRTVFQRVVVRHCI